MTSKKSSKKSKTRASYQSPGIYVEEVSSGARPIEAVGTSIAAFCGACSGESKARSGCAARRSRGGVGSPQSALLSTHRAPAQ
jgi:phage tail sheath protein FI